jgi:hypothetical protein
MAEENNTQIPQREAVEPASAGYALPQEAIRHMHNEASKLEKEAIPLMTEGFLHDGYCKLEISHALRVAANYCDGTAVKVA